MLNEMWNKIIYFRELCHYLIVTEGNGTLVQRKPSRKKSGLISVTITLHPLRSFVICNPECPSERGLSRKSRNIVVDSRWAGTRMIQAGNHSNDNLQKLFLIVDLIIHITNLF